MNLLGIEHNVEKQVVKNEHVAGEKIKSRWTKNDVIIAFLYTKFTLRKVGVTDDDTQLESFVNEYIGSIANSIKMESLNIKYLLCLKHNEQPEGLEHYSKTQELVVNEYDKYNENELSEIVNLILDSMTEEEKKTNLSIADGINAEINAEKEKHRLEVLAKKEEKARIALVKKTQKEKYASMSTDYKPMTFKQMNPSKVKYVSNIVNNVFASIGDVLDHKKYGKGAVKEIDGDRITIIFRDKAVGSKILLFDEKFFNLV